MKINFSAPAFLMVTAFFFSFLLAQAGTTGKALAADITLAWDLNGEPDLAGYKLYLGNHSRNYTQIIDLGLTTQYTIGNLMEEAIYFFTLTAYNQKGLESSFSNEVRYPYIEYTHKTFLPIVFQGS